jgi:glutamate-1-semialdehyde 2,1-aminomutase
MQTVTRTAVTTVRSAELREQALRLTPGGVHSNVRLFGPQLFIDHAKGCRIVDVDGNDYIDYLLGQGPNFLGHAPDDVLDAVDAACRRGMVFGAQHEMEITAAETVLDAIGWASSPATSTIRSCSRGTTWTCSRTCSRTSTTRSPR